MRNIQKEEVTKIRLLLLCPDEKLTEQIGEYFRNEDQTQIRIVATTPRLEDCRSLIQKAFPDVVLLVDVEQDASWTADLLQLCREITRDTPNIATILVASNLALDTTYLRDAMSAGARDVVGVARLGAGQNVPLFRELESSIWQAYKFIVERSGSGQPAVGKARGARATADPRSVSTIAFFSGKGGDGKSTLATAFASELARQLPSQRIAIIDLDVQYGAVGPILGVHKPEQTITQLVEMKLETNPLAEVERMLAKRQVGEAGVLHVLAAPHSPGDLRTLSSESCSAILATLRRHFDYLILDLPAQITDATIAALQVTDLLLLVCTPDMLSIRATRQTMSLFDERVISLPPTASTRIVLNKTSEQSLIPTEDILRVFAQEAVACFPDEARFIQEHVNRGQPLGSLPDSQRVGAKFLSELQRMPARLELGAGPTIANTKQRAAKQRGRPSPLPAPLPAASSGRNGSGPGTGSRSRSAAPRDEGARGGEVAPVQGTPEQRARHERLARQQAQKQSGKPDAKQAGQPADPQPARRAPAQARRDRQPAAAVQPATEQADAAAAEAKKGWSLPFFGKARKTAGA